jgi:tight adherence protein C
MSEFMQSVLGVGGGDAVVLGLIFIAVLILAFAAIAVTPVGDPLRRRLDPAAATAARAMSGGDSIRFTAGDQPFLKFLRKLGERMHGAEGENNEKVSSLRRKLIQAGFFTPPAVSVFFAARLLLGVGLPLTFSALLPLLSAKLQTAQILGIAVALGFIGAYAPAMFLTLRTKKRQRLAREGFPDALDMLLICVEAGLGLDAAVDRVGLEINRAHPLLAAQFAMLSAELRAGRRREDALRNLSDRIGIDEVGTLVTLLMQSEKLGTSLAQTLRVHSDEMRAKRMLKAEEKAGMLPVLLSIPLVLCILPALLTVVLTPAIIRVVRQLIPALSGGS